MRRRAPTAVVLALVCAPSARAQEPAARTGYDEGFFLRSADGRHELTLGGLFQIDALYYGAERDPETDFVLRKMRLELGFRVEERLIGTLETNFQADGVELDEAWVGFEGDAGRQRWMFGRMKAPFGLEELRGRKRVELPRYSLLNQFSPAEDHGVFVDGRSASGAWEYGAALYNGSGDADSNSSKDVALRAMWHPFAGRSDSAWEHLQLGLAGTAGSQQGDAAQHPVENELGREAVRFAPGTSLEDSRTRLGFELAWFRGPWFVQAEALWLEQELEQGASAERGSIQGAYVSVTHVLTGEDKTYAGIAPREPYDIASSTGGGAWAVVARCAQLDLDDDFATFALPGSFTDRIQCFALGLDWIANRHLLVRNAWFHTRYADELALDDGSSDHEDSLVVELQVSF